MRAVHVASSYPLTDSDSTAPFMAEMLEALARRGHEVSVLVPRVSGLEEGDRGGVKVIGVPYAPRGLQVWGYGRSLGQADRLRAKAAIVTPLALGAMARATRRAITLNEPDIVHLHWVLPLGALAPILHRDVAVVVSAHGADARFARGKLRRVARAALARADAVVAASSQILQALTDVHPSVTDKSRVVPHGANPALFHPRDREEARGRLHLDSREPVVIGVGRLVLKKGFDRLISALPLVRTTDAHLYLVGDGPERAHLEAAIPPVTADRVHFVGNQDRSTIPLWYTAADVVVVPSRPTAGDLDSGPVVLMEALASGRPVVAGPVGMVPDIVQSGANGFIVTSEDPASWAAAIDDAIADSARLGLAARSTFDRVGDWERVAESLEMTYGQAIEHRKQRAT